MTDPRPVKLMHCDLNWTVRGASAPHEWAFVDPQEYFDWHMAFGTNVMYCQAFVFGGTAFYPTKLGPWALCARLPGTTHQVRWLLITRSAPTHRYDHIGMPAPRASV